MRYVDGPVVEGDLHIDADQLRVWELVTDVELPARFSPELRRVRWLDGADRPVLGARFEGHNRNSFLGDWRSVSVVVELDPPRAFGWAVVDPYGQFGTGPADPSSPMARWRFRLAPEAGGVRLRLGARLGPARSGLTRFIDRRPDREEEIVAYRVADLRTGIEATLDGIRGLAERGR